MKIVNQPRQTGKSYNIAQAMKRDRKAVCVQPTDMAKHFFCSSFVIDPKRVYTVGNLDKIPADSDVYIDELEGFLRVLLKRRIVYCTTTQDE